MFQAKIETIYNKIKNKPCSGKNADYIPELAKVDSSLYAISIYTIDGQTINLGDYNHEFAIESCSKVFTLGLVLEKYGIPHLKKKIGEKKWNERMKKVLHTFRTVVNYDYLYISGGNAKKLTIPLAGNEKIVSNREGIRGGARLWK